MVMYYVYILFVRSTMKEQITGTDCCTFKKSYTMPHCTTKKRDK